METNICKKCNGKFADEEMAKVWAAEYEGGTAWAYEVSPCCGSRFTVEEE